MIRVFAEMSQNEAYTRKAIKQAMQSGMTREQANLEVRGNALKTNQKQMKRKNYQKQTKNFTTARQVNQ